MKHKLITAVIGAFLGLLLCFQEVVPARAAEQEGKAAAPAAQQAEPKGMMGMMHGQGMMQGGGMTEHVMPPGAQCLPMMGGGMKPMGQMGRSMMFGMDPGMRMDMMSMYADSKTRGQMMEIRGRMLQELGKLMEQRGKDIAAGNK